MRFLKNKATGVVFAWHEGMAKHPDVVEITAEEALEYLEAQLKRRDELDKTRRLIADMTDTVAVVDRLRKLAGETAQAEEKPAKQKKPAKKAKAAPSPRDTAALDVPEVDE